MTDVASHETVKYLIEKADANGYKNSKIINFHTVSHNSEFYGAKRVVRAEDGKLKRFDGVKELADEIRKDGKPIVVLVPLEYISQLTESDIVTGNVLANNGELAVVGVSLK